MGQHAVNQLLASLSCPYSLPYHTGGDFVRGDREKEVVVCAVKRGKKTCRRKKLTWRKCCMIEEGKSTRARGVYYTVHGCRLGRQARGRAGGRTD